MVEGTKTDENGDAILISLQEPYNNVVEVIGFTDEVLGEDTSCFITKLSGGVQTVFRILTG